MQAEIKGLSQWSHTHPFNGTLSGTTQVSQYEKGQTNVDFTEARDSEWQWNPLGHMHVCTLLQTENHASTPSLIFLQAGCPFCCPTNSVKALKANSMVSGQFKIHVTKKPEKISTTNRAWHVAFGTQFQRHLDRRLFHSVSQPLDFLWTRSIR